MHDGGPPPALGGPPALLAQTRFPPTHRTTTHYPPPMTNRRHTFDLRVADGQTMTEYGVLLALIAVIVIAALVLLGPKIADVFTNVGSKL